MRTNVLQPELTYSEKRKKCTELFSQVFRYFFWAVNYTRLQYTLHIFNQLAWWYRSPIWICGSDKISSSVNIDFYHFPPIAVPVFTYCQTVPQQKFTPTLIVLPPLQTLPNFIDTVSLLLLTWAKMPVISKNLKNCVTMRAKSIN